MLFSCNSSVSGSAVSVSLARGGLGALRLLGVLGLNLCSDWSKASLMSDSENVTLDRELGLSTEETRSFEIDLSGEFSSCARERRELERL